MPRAMTTEECRIRLLDQIDAIVRSVLTDERVPTAEEKVRLVVFSTLNVIDGGSCLPGFNLLTRPHPEDEQYHREQGENWWPTGFDLGRLVNPLCEPMRGVINSPSSPGVPYTRRRSLAPSPG